MPSWFVDHLACAPLESWLPDVFADRRVGLVDSVRVPRGLSSLLAGATPLGEGVRVDVLVHVGALHVAPSFGAEMLDTSGAEAFVDLARVDSLVGWWSLRPWRLAPVRRDAARRATWVGALGLVWPQQWVCRDPMPLVVTIAERRA